MARNVVLYKLENGSHPDYLEWDSLFTFKNYDEHVDCKDKHKTENGIEYCIPTTFQEVKDKGLSSFIVNKSKILTIFLGVTKDGSTETGLRLFETKDELIEYLKYYDDELEEERKSLLEDINDNTVYGPEEYDITEELSDEIIEERIMALERGDGPTGPLRDDIEPNTLSYHLWREKTKYRYNEIKDLTVTKIVDDIWQWINFSPDDKIEIDEEVFDQ